jgi:hypothetical protein
MCIGIHPGGPWGKSLSPQRSDWQLRWRSGGRIRALLGAWARSAGLLGPLTGIGPGAKSDASSSQRPVKTGRRFPRKARIPSA